jgi:hypothetical protein
MKNRVISILIAGIGIVAVLADVAVARGGQNGTDTISIAFARDEPNGAGCALDPTDVSGFVPSGNWNNVMTNAGLQTDLVEDVDGVPNHSGAQVLWYATNTWSSTGRNQENNNFTGADHTLMTGYLDMNDENPAVTFIQVSNLPPSFSGVYDVYIYSLAGVAGRGGIYSVNEAGTIVNGINVHGVPDTFQYLVSSGKKDPTKNDQGTYSGPDFVRPAGENPNFGAADFGNYLVFSGKSGPTVTITAVSQSMPQQNGYDARPRAAINAIQIVAE